MKYKTTLVAGIVLWLSLAGVTVYLLMGVNGFFRGLPDGTYAYQGVDINLMVTGIWIILGLLLAVTIAMGLYGLKKLNHATHIVQRLGWLAEEMRIKNAELEQKVSLLTGELRKTVTQLSQETEQRRLLAEQLKTQTTTDSATGLPNRGTGMVLLANYMEMSERFQWPLTIWSINIDNLKQVKERHGHECGDQMVKEVGRVIRTNIRESETLFRLGEDELMVILPRCSKEAATVIKERINKACQLDEQLNRCKWQPVMSHGLAEYQPGRKISVTDFVKQASLDARKGDRAPENK